MKIGYLFPGQGSQAVGMGRDFHRNSDTARRMFARADDALGYKLSQLCFEGPEEELKLTRHTQPALLTVSTIAFMLAEHEPDAAAGHSLGEYSALVAAGSLNFENAVLLVAKRGRYMQEAVPVGKGAMAALLGTDIEKVEEALSHVTEGVVQIANWNSRQQIVIAGAKRAVEAAVERIDPPRKVFLPVSAPFHCELMKSAQEKLSVDLNAVEFKDPKFPVISNVSAEVLRGGDEAREALRLQVTAPVRWYESMLRMREEGLDLLVEMGSGKVLAGLLKRIARGWEPRPTVMNADTMENLDRFREVLSEE